MLIIYLPHTLPTDASAYAFVLSNGQNVLSSGQASADTLPSQAGEVVAVVPHSRLSWFQVQLPPGSQGAKLTSVLQGLLEDRLLEDPEQVHLVLPLEGVVAARSGGKSVVAACGKAWLRDALAPLQVAGLTVQRLVPELSPSDTPVLYVTGSPDQALEVLTHPQGVNVLPSNLAHWQAFPQLSEPDLRVFAEPAMVEQVQRQLQLQPELQATTQRWLAASQSNWDLAQGEWAQGRQQKLLRLLQTGLQNLRHAPAWFPVRLGLVALLMIQVIALNVLAWQESQISQKLQAQLPAMLKSAFPKVTVVIDPVLQMQREVDALKLASGRLSPSDFEPLLAALGSVLPPGETPTQLHYVAQGLQLQGIDLEVEQVSQAQARLRELGYVLRQEGDDRWTLQVEAAR